MRSSPLVAAGAVLALTLGASCVRGTPLAQAPPVVGIAPYAPEQAIRLAEQSLAAQGFAAASVDRERGLLVARLARDARGWGREVRCSGLLDADGRTARAIFTVTVVAAPRPGGSSVRIESDVRTTFTGGAPPAEAEGQRIGCASSGVVEQRVGAAMGISDAGEAS